MVKSSKLGLPSASAFSRFLYRFWKHCWNLRQVLRTSDSGSGLNFSQFATISSRSAAISLSF